MSDDESGAVAGTGGLKQPIASKRYAAIIFLIILACAMYSPTLFSGRVLLPTDFLKFFYPWRSAVESTDMNLKNPAVFDAWNYFYPNQKYLKDSLAEGRAPLWNPYQSAGRPFAAGGAPAVFYPINVFLTSLLNPADFFGVYAFLHTLMAGVFMFLMLCAFRCRTESALLGATAYQLTGWLTVWTTFPWILTVAAWTPLALMFTELALRRRSRRMALYAGVVIGIMFTAGAVQLIVYASLAAAILCAGHIVAPQSPAPLLGRLCDAAQTYSLMLFTGVSVGAIQLFQLIDLLSQSGRRAGLMDTTISARPYLLATQFLPDIFGNASKGDYLMQPGWFLETTAYAGAAVLCLGLMALPLRRDRQSFVWTAIAAVGVCGALQLWFMRPLLTLPGFSAMRSNRMLFLTALAAAPLAALACDALMRRRGERGEIRFVAGLAAAAASALLMAGCAWFLLSMALHDSGLPRQKIFDALSPSVIRMAAAAACVFAAAALRRAWRTGAFALLLLAVAADLFSWGHGYNPAGDPKDVFPQTPAIEFLQRRDGLFRVHEAFNTPYPLNAATIFNLYDVRGYEPFSPERYLDLIGALNGMATKQSPRETPVVLPLCVDGPIMHLMNVRYLMTATPYRLNHMSLAHSGDVLIYHDPLAMDRAAFFDRWKVVRSPEKIRGVVVSNNFDPRKELYLEKSPGIQQSATPSGGAVRIVSYAPERIVIDVDARSAGLVFLSDAWAKGWAAEVDGKPARVLIADYAFRAVPVVEGKHRVVFFFRPLSLIVGFVVSMCAISACLCIVAFRRNIH